MLAFGDRIRFADPRPKAGPALRGSGTEDGAVFWVASMASSLGLTDKNCHLKLGVDTFWLTHGNNPDLNGLIRSDARGKARRKSRVFWG